MKPRAIAKHVGILTGPGTFLHAYERLGVIEEPLTPCLARRIAFAFLFPGGEHLDEFIPEASAVMEDQVIHIVG